MEGNVTETIDVSIAIDSDLLDTPKMRLDGTKISATLGGSSTINFDNSPSPGSNLVG